MQRRDRGSNPVIITQDTPGRSAIVASVLAQREQAPIRDVLLAGGVLGLDLEELFQ